MQAPRDGVSPQPPIEFRPFRLWHRSSPLSRGWTDAGKTGKAGLKLDPFCSPLLPYLDLPCSTPWLRCWPSTSPTFRRTPGRSCGPVPASMSLWRSSGRPGFRHPTDTSGEPGWTTLTMSMWRTTPRSNPFRVGETPKIRRTALFYSAPRQRRAISTRFTTPAIYLMVGRESAGVPLVVHAAADLRIAIPMRSPMRSLNVAIAASIVLGEVLRQLGKAQGTPPGERTAS